MSTRYLATRIMFIAIVAIIALGGVLTANAAPSSASTTGTYVNRDTGGMIVVTRGEAGSARNAQRMVESTNAGMVEEAFGKSNMVVLDEAPITNLQGMGDGTLYVVALDGPNGFGPGTFIVISKGSTVWLVLFYGNDLTSQEQGKYLAYLVMGDKIITPGHGYEKVTPTVNE